MPNFNCLTQIEKIGLLSTFDGCSIDFKLNDKNIFDSDNLILFIKNDALYVEHADKTSKKSDSTRLIILYENIDNVDIDDNKLTLSTKNRTLFNFSLKSSKHE